MENPTASVDIFVLSYQRVDLTVKSILYLNSRTKYPHRIFVIDNHSDDGTEEVLQKMMEDNKIFFYVRMGKNVGVHMGWNMALGLAESEYFVTMDNDIYVPDTDWLTQLVKLMDENPDYGAIACKPHVFLGASDPGEGLQQVGHCGAVARIMRKEAVLKAGGWERWYDRNRNHEEKTICGRLNTAGYKVGYADITCYHDFGEDNNWGYKDIHPHTHGHRIPGKEIWPPPKNLQIINQLDKKTWKKI